jgi:protocatechuate 3,4-dioxygenase beta subunit
MRQAVDGRIDLQRVRFIRHRALHLRRPAALLLLMTSALAAAQCATHPVSDAAPPGTVAQVRGRVFDQYGGSIPDATVLFQPADRRSGLQEFRVIADARGRFDFEAVRTGLYRVTCRAVGYETTVSTEHVRPGVENQVTLVLRAPRGW